MLLVVLVKNTSKKVFYWIHLYDIFVGMDVSMKELAERNKDFKKEYLATRESILIISMTIIAFSAILITLLIMVL